MLLIGEKQTFLMKVEFCDLIKLAALPVLLILFSLVISAQSTGYWHFTGEIIVHEDKTDPRYPSTTYKTISKEYNNLSMEKYDTWVDGINWSKYKCSFTWKSPNDLETLIPGEKFTATGELKHFFESSKIPPWGEAVASLRFDNYGLIKAAVQYDLPVLQMKAPTNTTVTVPIGPKKIPRVPNGPLGTKMTSGKYEGKYLIVLRASVQNGGSMAIDRVYEWVGKTTPESASQIDRDSRTKLIVIRGTVTLKRPGRGDPKLIFKGSSIPLLHGDRIETGPNTEVELVSDNIADLRVKSNSVLDYFSSYFHLYKGKSLCRIYKDKKARFYLSSYVSENIEGIAPTGFAVTNKGNGFAPVKRSSETEFSAIVDGDGNATIYAVVSKIKVADEKQRKTVVLDPGQKTSGPKNGILSDPVTYSKAELLKLMDDESLAENVINAPVKKEAETELFTTFNSDGVGNNPAKPAVFELSKASTITLIQTYHWNNGRGSVPGTLSLRRQDGTIYGPWQVAGTDASGATNVFWTAKPNLKLPAGIYTILDSDPRTWSQNSLSGNRGFVVIRGFSSFP